MPTAEQILAGLTAIANQWQGLALVWHLCFAILALSLLVGNPPSRRALALLLGLPLLSVSALAWANANPFNGTLFALLGLGSIALAFRLPSDNARFAAKGYVFVGALLFIFGWSYPHFLEATGWWTYLYAAPLGLIPCPTLAAVIGLGLMLGGLGSRVWAGMMAAAGLFYGIFGAVQLGVGLDWVLLAGSVVLLFQLLTVRT